MAFLHVPTHNWRFLRYQTLNASVRQGTILLSIQHFNFFSTLGVASLSLFFLFILDTRRSITAYTRRIVCMHGYPWGWLVKIVFNFEAVLMLIEIPGLEQNRYPPIYLLYLSLLLNGYEHCASAVAARQSLPWIHASLVTIIP